MAKAPWWQFDKDDPEDDELTVLEKQALDAVETIFKRADQHPDTLLMVSATLRKIHTIAGSRAQTLGLRIATVKGGRRL